MRHLLLSAAASLAVIGPVWAQVPPPGPTPYAGYSGSSGWRAIAPTPEDAYRDGLISRWQLEQAEGPLPQALQGPTPNGNRGMQSGGE